MPTPATLPAGKPQTYVIQSLRIGKTAALLAELAARAQRSEIGSTPRRTYLHKDAPHRITVSLVKEQFRFPRSKKKRIWKKWANKPENWRVPEWKPYFFTHKAPTADSPSRSPICCGSLNSKAEQMIDSVIVPLRHTDTGELSVMAVKSRSPVFRALQEAAIRSVEKQKGYDVLVRRREGRLGFDTQILQSTGDAHLMVDTKMASDPRMADKLGLNWNHDKWEEADDAATHN